MRFSLLALGQWCLFSMTALSEAQVQPADPARWWENWRMIGHMFGGRFGGCDALGDHFSSWAPVLWTDYPFKTQTVAELIAECKGDTQYLYSGGSANEQLWCEGCGFGGSGDTYYMGSYGKLSWPKDNRDAIERSSAIRFGSISRVDGKISGSRNFHEVKGDFRSGPFQQAFVKALNERNCDGILDFFSPTGKVDSNFGFYEGHEGIIEWCESMFLTAATTRGQYEELDIGQDSFFFHLYAGPDTFAPHDYTIGAPVDPDSQYIDNAVTLQYNDAGEIIQLKQYSNVAELPAAPTECLCCSDDADKGKKWSAKDLEDFDMEPYFAGWEGYWQGLSTPFFDVDALLSGLVDTDGCYFRTQSPLPNFNSISTLYEAWEDDGCEEFTVDEVEDIPIEGPRWFSAFGDAWGQQGIRAYVVQSAVQFDPFGVTQAPFITQGYACPGCGDDGEDWAVAQFHSSTHKPYHFTYLAPDGKLQQVHTMGSELSEKIPFESVTQFSGYQINELETRPVRDALVHALNTRNCTAFRNLYTDDATAVFSGGTYRGKKIEKYCKTQLFPTTSAHHFNAHGTELNYFSFSMQQYHPETMVPIESAFKFFTDGNVEGGAMPKITSSMQLHTVGLNKVKPQKCACCEGKSKSKSEKESKSKSEKESKSKSEKESKN